MADGINLDIQQLITKLDITDKKVNAAVNKVLKKSAEPLQEQIENKTKKSDKNVHRYGEPHAKDDVVITNVKGGAGDEKSVDVGYKTTAWRMKFVEFGTIYQMPQKVVQNSITVSKAEVLRIQAQELRKVLGT